MGASERHRGEKVRRSAVEGVFIMVVRELYLWWMSTYNRCPVTFDAPKPALPNRAGAFAAEPKRAGAADTSEPAASVACGGDVVGAARNTLRGVSCCLV